MVKDLDSSVSLKKGWLVSSDATQKLSAAMISPCLALLAYSFFQVMRCFQFQNDFEVDMKKMVAASDELVSKLPHHDTVFEISRASRSRLTQFKAAGFSKESNLSNDELQEWSQRIARMRANLRVDRGRLEQFSPDAYPLLSDTAKALSTQLDEEDGLWIAVQGYLDGRMRGTGDEEQEGRIQVILGKMLALFQSVGALDGTLLRSIDDLQKTQRDAHLSQQQLLSQVAQNKRRWIVHAPCCWLHLWGPSFA